MKVQDDTRRVIKFAEANGCTVKNTRKQHLKIMRDGMKSVYFSLTPSDHRAWRNCISQLRRELSAIGVNA